MSFSLSSKQANLASRELRAGAVKSVTWANLMEPYKTPNLPGFIFRDPRKEDYRKGQYMKVSASLMATRPPLIQTVTKQVEEHSRTISLLAPTMRSSETFSTSAGVSSALTEDEPPVYNPVLRFFAYFRETVTESNEEDQRVRYVRIHVFLEDDTVMIEEYRVRNSGMEQGLLLRRMRALNAKAHPYGTQYTNADFAVGTSIEIAGVVYRIYACDKFTEEYLDSVGRPVGAFEEPPDDLYSIKRKLTERPIRVGHQDTDKTHLHQFLQFDGKVLRFFATWDDTASLFGEKRNFLLSYYLVDDTIDIRQILPANSGRDPVAQFLKKTKLINPKTGQPYTDGDLQIGVQIHVFGREFLLYDADEWTRAFLDEKYGQHDWTPIDVCAGARRQQSERVLPPYNGWGDEEDSRGYCISLHPKPPRKDIVKYVQRDGQVLRFAAKFRNPAPQDRFRKFVIAFYLADDSVAVFELRQRNSGFGEGKFIERTRVQNVKEGRYFIASDFKLGEVITINGFEFITSEADEFALNLMEAESDAFTHADLAPVAETIRKSKTYAQRLKRQFEQRDEAGKGYVDPSIAEQILMRICGLSKHEATTVTRRWSNDWGFDYFGFLSAVVQ
jgi:hypothetical protein